ncbi:MAG: DEAD/DEAH box helicase, partial [Candidatus Omnitrophica bacterium]|nr:DEAD/DEAH box helicase [Candidatus Omnitrophota bacterium]
HINNGFSVIVAAPTGAGKTAIAEHVINEALLKGSRVVYTAPIKALSNQKFRDFHETYPGKIGILTGDVSIDPDAPILIMTTEIFRNKVLSEERSLNEYSWIIFDEVHYLDNYERGTVWEESLIFLPEHMNVLALSATIPNIDEFAEWIHSVHKKPVKVVKEDTRPVPLHFYFQCRGEIINNISRLKKGGFFRTEQRGRFSRHSYFRAEQHHARQNRLSSLMEHLSDSDRLPCICFAFGRRRCEYLAEEMTHFDLLMPGEKNDIVRLYDALLDRFDLAGERSAEIMRPLVKRGIAFHHAGMLPTLKEVIERLFTSRLLKVIFTTETFALGINMPARTVVFDDLRKFYGQFHAALKTRDFYQMAGRAGRRGIDPEGFVYLRVNPHRVKFHEIERMIFGRPEMVRSRLNASYATLLNLYQRYGDGLYEIYPLSFHCFQEKEKQKARALDAIRSKVGLLEELGYIYGSGLTPKGDFASKVYGYELPLAELYEIGLLEDLSAEELAIISAALVFEPRRAAEMPRVAKPVKRLAHAAGGTIANIHRMEKKRGITPLCKELHFHLSSAVEVWMRGGDFQDILKLVDTDEGELIRYFRMAVQILREVLDTHASASFKERVKKAAAGMNRDMIDAEKQLRS